MEERKKSKSGILINDIFYHKMKFTFIENFEFIEKFDKLIKIEQKGEIAIQKFVEELKSMKIFNEINQNINDSPEDNYN